MRDVFISRIVIGIGFLLMNATAEGVQPGTMIGPVDELTCAPGNPDVAAALEGSTVWVTKDGGRTFEKFHITVHKRAPTVDERDTMTAGPSSVSHIIEQGGDDGEETEEDVDATEDDTLDASDSEVSPVSIAVSNDGRFAVASTRGVIYRHRYSPSPRLLSLEGGRQVLFDEQGRLYILTERELIRIGHNGQLDCRRASRHAVGIVHGPRPGEITLISPTGLSVFNTSSSRLEPRTRVAIPNVLWAAPAASVHGSKDDRKESWFVLRNGQIKEVFRDGRVIDTGLPLIAASRIVVGRDRRPAVFAGAIGWLLFKEHSFSKHHARHVAVDSIGRFWFAGAFGLAAPALAREAQQYRRFDMSALTVRHVDGTRLTLDAPPKCRRYTLSPLPDVAVGVSRMGGSVFSSGDARRERQWEAGLSFSIRLVWRLEAEKGTVCLNAWERYRRSEQSLRDRLLALKRQQRRHRLITTGQSLQSMIDREVFGERLSAQVKIMENNYSKGKE